MLPVPMPTSETFRPLRPKVTRSVGRLIEGSMRAGSMLVTAAVVPSPPSPPATARPTRAAPAAPAATLPINFRRLSLPMTSETSASSGPQTLRELGTNIAKVNCLSRAAGVA